MPVLAYGTAGMNKQAAEEYAEIRRILKEGAEQSKQTERKGAYAE